jgi:hypothetical protein
MNRTSTVTCGPASNLVRAVIAKSLADHAGPAPELAHACAIWMLSELAAGGWHVQWREEAAS